MATRKPKVRPFGQDIQSGPPGAILARMYRKILSDLGVTSDRYDALMNRYVAKAQLYPNRKEKAAARASLSKELLKEFMTWKTLVKGIMFLAVPKFDLSIRLHHASGRSQSTASRSCWMTILKTVPMTRSNNSWN